MYLLKASQQSILFCFAVINNSISSIHYSALYIFSIQSVVLSQQVKTFCVSFFIHGQNLAPGQVSHIFPERKWEEPRAFSDITSSCSILQCSGSQPQLRGPKFKDLNLKIKNVSIHKEN